MLLIYCLLKPIYLPLFYSYHSLAFCIAEGEIVLCFSIACFCRFSVPSHGLSFVLLNSLSVKIAVAQVALSFFIPIFSSSY